MLDYLVSLLDDAQDFSRGAAKTSHAVLLCRMEQGEISDYSCTEKIDRIRRANAQRHGSPKTSIGDRKVNQKPTKVMPCKFFNQNSCSFGKTHETKCVLYRHVCSHCFGTLEKILAIVNQIVITKQKIQKMSEHGCAFTSKVHPY